MKFCEANIERDSREEVLQVDSPKLLQSKESCLCFEK